MLWQMNSILNSQHFFAFFNKFNNTGARMFDSVYHMTLKLLKNYIFLV